MAHIHLSWELGGGLGHVGRLKMLAQALLARGHRVSMSLRDLAHPQNLLADLDVPKFQAPVWLHQVGGLPPTQGNLAETLFLCGYHDIAALRGLATGWQTLLRQLRPDLLVADYAPTAILAARSLGLRSVSVGNGFYSPPPGQPLPPTRDWEAIPPSRLQASEAYLLNAANAVLAEVTRGGPVRPFAHAADLLLGDAALLCTFPELDHYARAPSDAQRWYGPNFLPETGAVPHWPEGTGRKVFVYLKTLQPQYAALLQALVDEGCGTLCYAPDVAAGRTPPVSSPLLHYAATPVSMAQALQSADLCICHAGEATLAQALLAGVPLLMLPTQAEQFLMARRVAAAAAGINLPIPPAPEAWRGVLSRLLDEPGFGAAASAFAARYRDFDQKKMTQELVEVFERNLPPECASPS